MSFWLAFALGWYMVKDRCSVDVRVESKPAFDFWGKTKGECKLSYDTWAIFSTGRFGLQRHTYSVPSGSDLQEAHKLVQFEARHPLARHLLRPLYMTKLNYPVIIDSPNEEE